jgi:hypothetical protein
VATAKVSPISSSAQFLDANPGTRVIAERSVDPVHRFSMHVAVIQLPVRKWEKPWRHQRAIVLFTESPEETKLRLHLEDRIGPGEHILQIIAVGE